MEQAAVQKAQAMIKKYKSRDPFLIAQAAGALVRFKDLGRLQGMYTCIKRNRFIVLNSALDEAEQRMVCAHELGHDQLHRRLAADRWLQEFMLYPMDSQPEYEANLFAAELLLEDGAFLELAGQGTPLERIAAEFSIDQNLAALKAKILSSRGYPIRQVGYRSDFLKGR